MCDYLMICFISSFYINSLMFDFCTRSCSRIEFYSTFFSNMTSVETKFHEEMAKVSEVYILNSTY